MSDPFVGEVQIFGFPFAPRYWSYANGALISIRQSTTLYALYGTLFGGDGVSTFALPNLVTRSACGTGQSPGNSQRSLGQTFGTPGVSLSISQMPPHNHTLPDYQPLNPSGQVTVPVSTGGVGSNESLNAFAPPGAAAIMDANAIGASGGGVSHENRQPFLGLNYCVALIGIYPSFD